MNKELNGLNEHFANSQRNVYQETYGSQHNPQIQHTSSRGYLAQRVTDPSQMFAQPQTTQQRGYQGSAGVITKKMADAEKLNNSKMLARASRAEMRAKAEKSLGINQPQQPQPQPPVSQPQSQPQSQYSFTPLNVNNVDDVDSFFDKFEKRRRK